MADSLLSNPSTNNIALVTSGVLLSVASALAQYTAAQMAKAPPMMACRAAIQPQAHALNRPSANNGWARRLAFSSSIWSNNANAPSSSPTSQRIECTCAHSA